MNKLTSMTLREHSVSDIGALSWLRWLAAVARYRQEVAHLCAILRLWALRARQRRQLLAMSPHLLRDIGLSRYDAEHEARKPFWQS